MRLPKNFRESGPTQKFLHCWCFSSSADGAWDGGSVSGNPPSWSSRSASGVRRDAGMMCRENPPPSDDPSVHPDFWNPGSEWNRPSRQQSTLVSSLFPIEKGWSICCSRPKFSRNTSNCYKPALSAFQNHREPGNWGKESWKKENPRAIRPDSCRKKRTQPGYCRVPFCFLPTA